jgi:predicted N-formylglutamate amidohydrolase
MSGRTDPAPVEVFNAAATTPLLLICDHGGQAVPADMVDAAGPLGIPAAHLSEHIGWDIGAAAVARRIATALKATAVIASYTRLLIDANRPLGDPDCIPSQSDGIAIPANRNIDAATLHARAAAFYWPYHIAIDVQLARLKAWGSVPLLVSMHSFTPALKATGAPRPMQVGVMASRDMRLADALLTALRAQPGLTVTFNEPYSGITHGYCLKMHGLAQGLPHAQIEIRQDLIADETGQAKWAALLSDILTPIVANSALHAVAHY